MRLILMNMGHRLMTCTAEAPIYLNNKSQGSSNWVVHKAQYLLRFCKWGSKLSGLDCGENSTVKHAWARGILGWVTTRESWLPVAALEVMIDAMQLISLVSIPLLHPCEHHPMQIILRGLFKSWEVSILVLHPCEHHPMQWVLIGLFKSWEVMVNCD